MTFFEIDETIRAILDSFEVDEETGEILSDIDFDLIESLKMERNFKLESMAMFFKELAYEIEALKEEAKKLKERAAIKERKMDSIKNYLSNYLQQHEDLSNGMETAKVKLSFRSSESVEISNPDIIPRVLCRVKYEPDKKLIKEAIKAEVKVPGAELVKKNNLSIK